MPDCLADSNIWLRLAEPSHAIYSIAEIAMEKILARFGDIYLEPQVVTEYWRLGLA